jgi:hypothetical protein
MRCSSLPATSVNASTTLHDAAAALCRADDGVLYDGGPSSGEVHRMGKGRACSPPSDLGVHPARRARVGAHAEAYLALLGRVACKRGQPGQRDAQADVGVLGWLGGVLGLLGLGRRPLGLGVLGWEALLCRQALLGREAVGLGRRRRRGLDVWGGERGRGDLGERVGRVLELEGADAVGDGLAVQDQLRGSPVLPTRGEREGQRRGGAEEGEDAHEAELRPPLNESGDEGWRRELDERCGKRVGDKNRREEDSLCRCLWDV